MVESNNIKIVDISPPKAIQNNGSPATASIDTKGYDWCDIYIHLGATDIALTVLKLQESDSDSLYGDIVGANFATGTNRDGTAAALPIDTDDNLWWRFSVNLKGRKRFLDLVATVGNGSLGAFFTAFAILSRAKESPNTMAEAGLKGDIVV